MSARLRPGQLRWPTLKGWNSNAASGRLLSKCKPDRHRNILDWMFAASCAWRAQQQMAHRQRQQNPFVCASKMPT